LDWVGANVCPRAHMHSTGRRGGRSGGTPCVACSLSAAHSRHALSLHRQWPADPQKQAGPKQLSLWLVRAQRNSKFNLSGPRATLILTRASPASSPQYPRSSSLLVHGQYRSSSVFSRRRPQPGGMKRTPAARELGGVRGGKPRSACVIGGGQRLRPNAQRPRMSTHVRHAPCRQSSGAMSYTSRSQCAIDSPVSPLPSSP
jgi:hypothetical protein